MNTKRTLLVLLFVCTCVWVDGDAHAQLKSSNPPAGALLERAPKQVALRFTEAVELAFVQLTLYDDQGRAMPPGTLSVDPHDPTRIQATLPPLERGTYTVAWQATSASDGHVTRGSFPFSVGVVSDVHATVNATHVKLALGRVATRWSGFLGLFAWLGGALFALFVVRQDANKASTLARTRLLTLTRWGAGVVLLAELADFVYQAASVVDVSWWAGLHVERWRPLLSVYYGQLAATRVATSALWLLLSWGLPRWHFTLAALLGTTLALARSLSGHGAALASGSAVAVVVDGLHLVSLSAWLGGLLALLWLWPAITSREDESAGARALWLPRFSRLALGSMGVIVASGLYSAWRHLPDVYALWTSGYGRALLAKALLLFPVLLLAAPNLLRRVPRLNREFKGQVLLRLQRSVRLEVLLAVLILAFGALLTLLPPASLNAPPTAAFAQTQTISYQERALQVTLSVTPTRVGPAHVEVTVKDGTGAAVEVQRVRLVLTYLEQNLGPSAVTLEANEDGRYAAVGAFFSVNGRWQVEVEARFRGQAHDARATFEFNIG